MSNTFIATLGGIAALLGWGFSDYLAARTSRKFSAFETNAAIQIPGMVLALPILFLTGQHMPGMHNALIIAASSLSFTCAYLLFIKALSTGAVGIVAPIANAFPLVTLILSVLFLSATFSGTQIFSMISIIIGAVLLAYEKRKKGLTLRDTHKETLLAIAAAVVWGFGFFIMNSIVAKETWQIIAGILSVIMGIVSIVLLYASTRKIVLSKLKVIHRNYTGIFAGVILTVSTFAFYAAGHHAGNIVIPAVIGAAGPLITALLAAVIDKESINFIRRVGAVIVVAGIVLLNTVS